MYAVQSVDYGALVREMSDAGLKQMGGVLGAHIATLVPPVWRNEQTYFWKALFNAAKTEERDEVWLWLCTQPGIRHYAPPDAAYQTSAVFVELMGLPLIGGSDDERLPDSPATETPPWSSDVTEENLRAQATDLDRRLQEGWPAAAPVMSLTQYVATFWDSGSGQMVAQTTIVELGYLALASREGIVWLVTHYGPASK